MIGKVNYSQCLTNFACSIRKYFGLEYHHQTLEEVDQLLEQFQPEHVITILCDGMGAHLLDRILPEDSFFRTHKLKTISSVFPPTTVAALTAAATGLNPAESGMLGWNMYYKELDEIISVFMNSRKGDSTYAPVPKAVEYRKKHMKETSVVDEINEQGTGKAWFLIPFQPNPYRDLDHMLEIIEQKCLQKGRKYIFAYDIQPDDVLHEKGCDSEEVKEILQERNDKIEALCRRLNNAMIFVIADHGHIDVQNLDLDDYPDLLDCLSRDPSLEPRAVNFFVKEGRKKEFEVLFRRSFSEDFDLYSMKDVIAGCLFGDGPENEIFRDALGDYLAIAKTDKTLISKGGKKHRSHHAGSTNDEILVPLIVINRCLKGTEEKAKRLSL